MQIKISKNKKKNYRGAPKPEIDGRASATVIRNDTRVGKITLALNIPILQIYSECERRRRERIFLCFRINYL